jgi:hypothetical protein
MLANLRKFSTPRKQFVLGCTTFLVAGLATATVGVAGGSAASPFHSSESAGAVTSRGTPDQNGQVGGSTQLLPGDQNWNGTSSFVYGTNDSIEYASSNVDTVPSVQADLKAAGLTLMRTWVYSDYSDADINLRLTTIENSGMECMIMLGDPKTGLAWMEHVVSLAGSRCNIYEFGNEPDYYTNDTDIADMTAEWIADVPALKAINPNAVFGGPAVTWSASSDGSQGSYPSDMAYFLAETAAAGVRADFISYHDYPCLKATTKAQCIEMTPGDFKWNWDQVIGWEQTYYGGVIPTGVSEYNFDSGTGNLYAWGDDGKFMRRWTTTALHAIVHEGMAFANQFTSLNYSGYGYLDMFREQAPYRPKAQEKAMAAAVAAAK